jgi:CheY-like chemotaxis protein
MIDKVTAVPHISAPEKDAKPVRLLLVEDSDADAYLITSAARELSYALEIQRFVTADRAIAGLEAGLPAPPQGALLDLNLPGGSGLDVLRSIRGNKQTRNLRVVVMTSSISIRDREAAELLGVDGYLLKPSDYKLFVDAVGVALRSIFGGG